MGLGGDDEHQSLHRKLNVSSLEGDDKRPQIDVEKVAGLFNEKLWAQHLYNQFTRRQFENVVLYGTSHPEMYTPTRWQRIKWAIQDFFGRVRDAWKVLTGKAEIYDGQDD